MKNRFKALIVLLIFLGINFAKAATVSLPSTIYFTPGESIAVDINISGLGEHALGAFDITLGFGPYLYQSATLGSGLGTTLFDTIENTNPNNPVRLSQVSLELAADLVAKQPDSFTLATVNLLTSSGTNGGPGRMSFGDIILSDENGDPLAYDVNQNITLVNRNEQPAAIPLPASWLLFTGGLAMVASIKRKAANRYAA